MKSNSEPRNAANAPIFARAGSLRIDENLMLRFVEKEPVAVATIEEWQPAKAWGDCIRVVDSLDEVENVR